MEPLRNERNDQEVVSPQIQQFSAPEPVEIVNPNPNVVTYAQIMRPSPQPQYVNLGNELDFRLQTPQPNVAASQTSGRSSISSGYIDLTNNLSGRNYVPPHVQQPTNINRRPQSPETSF